MLKRITFIFCLTLLCNLLSAQIITKKTSVDYSLKIQNDSVYRILTFWKHKDSTIYSSVKYSISDFNKISSEKNLIDEIENINQLWDIAKDSIEMNLESFNISYPLYYSDVLKNHIKAFNDSKEWQNHVKLFGKKLDYDMIKKVMLESNVYKPLIDFLKTKDYSVKEYETEKHGFVTKENLQKAGFPDNNIVPLPFIVCLSLSKY